MSTRERKPSATSQERDRAAELLRRYGCGSIRFSGTDNGYDERHLAFDNVEDPADTGRLER